jgi:hypothetical protein
MPKLRSETFTGSGDQRWIGAPHGLYDTLTCTIDISAFTAGTHYPNGYLPSGTRLNIANEQQAIPFVDGAGAKLGFLYTDQQVVPATGVGAKDFAAPVLAHGVIKIARLPGAAFTPPTTAPATGFVFRATVL